MIVRVQSAAELQNGIYYEYETESLPLGQGGMGTVYQGYCFREGDRDHYIPVAIKKIAYTSHELIDKAMREASIQIDHDNLLRMYGFIPNWEYNEITKTKSIQYYVVMEVLQGVNLDALINGQLTDKFGNVCEYAQDLYNLYNTNRLSFVKKIMSDVLSGVQALHEAGYIHRDLDPSNVMITHEGSIKVIDYGISKMIDCSNTDTNKGTVPGSMMGKVDYAAPEMITGDVNHHNATTDIYALGIMTYQLLVGSVPFDGDAAKVAKDQLGTPVPVVNISDPIIASIVSKATQKDQANRYQSINEILDDYKKLSLAELDKMESNDYQKLNAKDTTLDQMYHFLSTWPQSKHFAKVEAMIEARKESDSFQQISKDSDLKYLEKFLNDYPKSAKKLIVTSWIKQRQEKADFQQLSINSSKKDFQDFLNKYPYTTFKKEFRELRKAAKKHQRKPMSMAVVIILVTLVSLVGLAIGIFATVLWM